MRYNLYGFINIGFRTLVLWLFLEKLILSLILAVIIEILANLSRVKRILTVAVSLVKLEDSEKSYLDGMRKEIDEELSHKGIYKINYNLQVVDENELIIYALGDNRIYLDRSFLNLNKSKLKGAIYHELGHIYYGDISYVSNIIIGNLIFFLVLEIILIIQGFYLLAILMIFIFYIGISIKLDLFNKNNLKREIRADRFVLFMGYGSDLLEVLLEYKQGHDEKLTNISSSPSKKYLELKKRVSEIEKNEV